MDNHHVDGVGRLSMLAQGALDEAPSDINVGVKKSANDDSPVTFEEAQNESGLVWPPPIGAVHLKVYILMKHLMFSTPNYTI
ncbi:hypothetical protein ACI65C_010642 [Semiaphis heraclei]